MPGRPQPVALIITGPGQLGICLKRLAVARPSEKAMGKDAGGKSPQSYL